MIKCLPTCSTGINCEKAVIKKNKLKKNLNSLYRTTGKNVINEYF